MYQQPQPDRPPQSQTPFPVNEQAQQYLAQTPTYINPTAIINQIKITTRLESNLLNNTISFTKNNLNQIIDPTDFMKQTASLSITEILASINESKAQLIKTFETHQATINCIQQTKLTKQIRRHI